MTINTVLGPINADDLGVTLVHEHVVTASAGIWQTYPQLLGNLDQLTEAAIAALVEARDGGVRTIVDLTTMDLGRNVRLLAEVSRRSGVNIVAATGCWRDIPRAIYLRSPDAVAELFVRELEEGIEDTGIKAGIIKVASDQEGVTPEAEVVLRAAARAAKRTGCPISTHSYAPGRVGDRQLEILADEGMDLGRVCIGHSNDTDDLGYLLGLARRGAYVGLDRYPGRYVGSPPLGPDWEGRTAVAARLVEAGAGDQILLSHDWAVLLGHRTSDLTVTRQSNPDGYLFISRRVLPRLRELGLTDAQLDAIMVESPRRFLTGGA